MESPYLLSSKTPKIPGHLPPTSDSQRSEEAPPLNEKVKTWNQDTGEIDGYKWSTMYFT